MRVTTTKLRKRLCRDSQLSTFADAAHGLLQLTHAGTLAAVSACGAQAIQIIVSVPGFQSFRCRVCFARFVVTATTDTESHPDTSSAQPIGVTPTARSTPMQHRRSRGPL